MKSMIQDGSNHTSHLEVICLILRNISVTIGILVVMLGSDGIGRNNASFFTLFSA